MSFGRSFGSFGGRDSGPKPVSVGEELEVTIEAVASKGDGIAKKEGFVIFVPNVKTGDKARIKITDLKRSCAIAEVISDTGSAPSDDDSSEEADEASEEAVKEEASEEQPEA